MRATGGALLWSLPLALFVALAAIFVVALRTPPQISQAPTHEKGSGEFPITIKESSGREVKIPAYPRRIIAADAGTADILASLSEPERIVAVPMQVDEFSGAAEFYGKHREIPRFERFQAETLLAYNPDLVLVTRFHDDATTHVLEANGIPVLTFEAFKTFGGIRGSLAIIGHAIGNPQAGDALQAQFDSRLAAVEKAVAGKQKPRVLAYSNYGQGFAVGTGESQDEIIHRAGAENAAAEMNLVGHVNFSFEQMIKLNPDWLVVSGDKGMDSPQVKVLLNETSLANLPALRDRRIAVVPDRFYSSTSHYVVDAVEVLAKQLHPDAFKPETTNQKPQTPK